MTAVPPFDMRHMADIAPHASDLLRVLANEDRLMLMSQLSLGEKSVGELETLLGIRQPTLSQQLGILRQKNLVSTRRNGKQIIYSATDPHALEMLRTLYAMYSLPA